MKPASNREAPVSWDALLIEAVNTPGTISAAYHAFHNYSVGNQILAFWQCTTRGIQPGPLGTFNAWKEKGRMVRKGEKAIVLCQPKTSKRTAEDEETGKETTSVRVFFSYRAAWFTVSQTDGEDATAPALPEWTADRALAALNVSRAPFAVFDGNTQGYAFNRSIAINPVAANPLKTTAHELAHVLLGHSDSAQMDGANLPRNLKEVEAEAVALIVVESLGQLGADNARGYIQDWLGSGQTIPEANAQRIFSAANRILVAGRPANDGEADHE